MNKGTRGALTCGVFVRNSRDKFNQFFGGGCYVG